MNIPRGPASNVPRPSVQDAHSTWHPPAHPGPGSRSEGRPPPVPYRTYETHPVPAAHDTVRGPNGSVIHTRADGSRAEIHDVHRGMDIHYGLNGSRRVFADRADHSRVFVERGGHGYVQHPYVFHGQEIAHRTYWEHGHATERFYGGYNYHGVHLEVYAPVRFYSVGFYHWVYAPWVAPVHYVWVWRSSPWYRYYGYYFVPYSAYASAPLWLTDYLIATSLEAAYAAQVRAQMAAGGAPPLSDEVKDEIADEVKYDVQQEMAEAQMNVSDPHGVPANGGLDRLLGDGHAHVFVAGSVLDLEDGGGNECVLTPGDVVQVLAAPAPGAQAVNATVLVSKGGSECTPNGSVRVPLPDLQEMQNYMRETVDQGIADLQAKQGTANLPAAPAAAQTAPVSAGFTVGAPPPDPNAAAEISAEAAVADQAEREDINEDPQ